MDVTWFAEKPLLKINLGFILHNCISSNVPSQKLDRQQQSKTQSRHHQIKVDT